MAYEADLFECLGLCTDGQYESRDSLLVFVPRSYPHGTVRIIKEVCKAQSVLTVWLGVCWAVTSCSARSSAHAWDPSSKAVLRECLDKVEACCNPASGDWVKSESILQRCPQRVCSDCQSG